MADLKAYLASKYMSGAKADAILSHASASGDGKRKKKKRKLDGGTSKEVVDGGGLVIADDDGMGWARKDDEEDDEHEDNQAVVQTKRGDFKAKSGSWQEVDRKNLPLSARTPSPEPEPDDGPTIVDTPATRAFVGGLQTAEDLARANEQRKADAALKRKIAEREIEARKKEAEAAGEVYNETIYRDAQGKKIDTKALRAEEKRKEREEMELKMKRMEWGKGTVQKEEEERKKREAEELLSKPMARYADDEKMNDEMKEVDRWNDPAANFLTKKKKDKGPRKPAYSGPAPAPNRFGIKPGYRWDGVDRSNGFEHRWMQAANSASVRTAQAYKYGASDM